MMNGRDNYGKNYDGNVKNGGGDAKIENKAVMRQVRHSFCGRRLFDSRRVWVEVPISMADIIIRCGKCRKLVGLAEAAER